MTNAEQYRRCIDDMCKNMTEAQLQRILARVQHVWLMNCRPQKVKKENVA